MTTRIESNNNYCKELTTTIQGNHNYHELPQIALLKENKGTTIYPKQSEELQLLKHITRKRKMRRVRIDKGEVNHSMN